MAVILSTIDTTGQLTGNQHRAMNQSLTSVSDYVVKDYGSALASTYTGWKITVGTGMAVLMGTIIENTTPLELTFPQPTSSGTAMVIAKVNLATGIASLELKTGTTLLQNNLLANVTGTREIELYRFTHSTSAITGFTDKRILVENSRKSIVDLIYPVGSIYMSVSSTTPATLFGGTWSAWGTGRVPVAIDASQTEFNTVEKTGGAKTHTLSVNEMPSHNHTVTVSWLGEEGGGYPPGTTFPSVNASTTGTTWAGGGQAHYNLQPYITCYMWKRTA